MIFLGTTQPPCVQGTSVGPPFGRKKKTLITLKLELPDPDRAKKLGEKKVLRHCVGGNSRSLLSSFFGFGVLGKPTGWANQSNERGWHGQTVQNRAKAMPQRRSVADSLNCSLTVFASGGGWCVSLRRVRRALCFLRCQARAGRASRFLLWFCFRKPKEASGLTHAKARRARAARARARPVPGSYLCRQVDRVFLTCSFWRSFHSLVVCRKKLCV